MRAGWGTRLGGRTAWTSPPPWSAPLLPLALPCPPRHPLPPPPAPTLRRTSSTSWLTTMYGASLSMRQALASPTAAGPGRAVRTMWWGVGWGGGGRGMQCRLGVVVVYMVCPAPPATWPVLLHAHNMQTQILVGAVPALATVAVAVAAAVALADPSSRSSSSSSCSSGSGPSKSS